MQQGDEAPAHLGHPDNESEWVKSTLALSEQAFAGENVRAGQEETEQLIRSDLGTGARTGDRRQH